jgi:hypothetical protein
MIFTIKKSQRQQDDKNIWYGQCLCNGQPGRTEIAGHSVWAVVQSLEGY